MSFKIIFHQVIPPKYRILIYLSALIALASGIFDALSINEFYIITETIQAEPDVQKIRNSFLTFGAFTITAYLGKISLLWLNIWLSFRLAGHLNLALLQNALNINNKDDQVSDTLNDLTRITELVSLNYILGILKFWCGIIISLVIIGSLLTTSNGYASILIFGLIFIYFLLSLGVRRLFRTSSIIINEKTKETVSLAKSILASRETISALAITQTISERWYKSDYELKTAQINSQFSANSPRLFIELIGIVLILIFVGTLPGNINQMLAELALLALVAQRILPIIQQVYASQSAMRVCKKMYEDTYRKLPKIPQNIETKRHIDVSTVEISVQIKSFTYTCALAPGGILKINGASGSGKTTLLRSIIGLSSLFPTTIRVNGKNVQSLIGNIAYSSQATDLFKGTLRENIDLFEKTDEAKYTTLISVCQLTTLQNRLKNKVIDPDGAQLSGGERQRIFLARNLAISADIIVLDEAFVGLDLDLARKVLADIYSNFKDKIFIVVEHSELFDDYERETINV